MMFRVLALFACLFVGTEAFNAPISAVATRGARVQSSPVMFGGAKKAAVKKVVKKAAPKKAAPKKAAAPKFSLGGGGGAFWASKSKKSAAEVFVNRGWGAKTSKSLYP